MATTDFAGDLDPLEAELVGRLRSSLQARRDIEAKLSHLADLRARMTAAGVDGSRLAAAAALDKATLTKARHKVLDQALEGRAMTAAMRHTPRVRLDRRARYGHWDRFPVNPDRWYEQLAGPRPSADVSKKRNFAVTSRLRDRLARYDGPRRHGAERLALYRAFHTVGVELAERGDDSNGHIGELRLDAVGTYVSIDWAHAGIEPSIDICLTRAALVEAVNDLANLDFQLREFADYDLPHDGGINEPVPVRQQVSHVDHLTPRYFWILSAKLGRHGIRPHRLFGPSESRR